MLHLLLHVVLVLILSTSLQSLDAAVDKRDWVMFDGEHLPPFAFYNRTEYPAIIDYSKRHGGRRPELALGVLSDIQYGDRKTQDRRHYRMSPAKLDQAVSEIAANRTHLDLVVNLGDLVDSDIFRHGPPMLKTLDKLKSQFPVFHLLGNHDFLQIDESKFDEVAPFLRMPSRYYSIAAGRDKRYRLIFLDGNDVSMYATKAGSDKRKQAERMIGNLKKLRSKNAQAFNGGIGDEQLLWLKKQLGAACRSKQRAIVMLHHAVRPKGDRTNLWNDFALVDTVTQFHCAIAILNGHAHKFNYDFAYSRHRQVHMVTFGGMVQSPFQSYAFADFYDDELHVHGLVFGREIDYKLDLKMHAAAPPTDNADGGDGDESTSMPRKREVEILSTAATSVAEKGGDDAAAAAATVPGEVSFLLHGVSWVFPVLSVGLVAGFVVVLRLRGIRGAPSSSRR